MNSRGRCLDQYFTHLVLIIASIIALLPIGYTLLISIKEPVDAFSMPPKIIFNPTLSHHLRIWTQTEFPRYLVNSLVIAFGTVLLAVPVASLGGFAFARIRTGTTRLMLFLILAFRMFPRILLVLPFFLLARTVGLFDTHLIMVLVMAAFNLPFTIWLMRGFFLEIPQELEEAALVDGCSPVTAFIKVILPVVKPGLVAATIFGFLLAYNEYFFALILTGTKAKTLPVAIAEYGGESIEYWSLSAAAAIGIVLPVVILILFLQRYLVRGLTFGAVKG